MTAFYRDIKVEAGIAYRLHERLMAVVHWKITEGADLSVSWPHYCRFPAHLGLTMRIFGSQKELEAYGGAIRALTDAGLVSLSAIEKTPVVQSTVTFYRYRKTEKKTEKASLRRQSIPATGLSAPFFIPMRSCSTGQSYSLCLDVQENNPAIRGGVSFGLGRPVPQF